MSSGGPLSVDQPPRETPAEVHRGNLIPLVADLQVPVAHDRPETVALSHDDNDLQGGTRRLLCPRVV